MSDQIRNVIIIGSGPAALTAGLFTGGGGLLPPGFGGKKKGGGVGVNH